MQARYFFHQLCSRTEDRPRGLLPSDKEMSDEVEARRRKLGAKIDRKPFWVSVWTVFHESNRDTVASGGLHSLHGLSCRRHRLQAQPLRTCIEGSDACLGGHLRPEF